MTFQYDVEGRLSKAFQTNAPTQAGTYGYDALQRLRRKIEARLALLWRHLRQPTPRQSL